MEMMVRSMALKVYAVISSETTQRLYADVYGFKLALTVHPIESNGRLLSHSCGHGAGPMVSALAMCGLGRWLCSMAISPCSARLFLKAFRGAKALRTLSIITLGGRHRPLSGPSRRDAPSP